MNRRFVVDKDLLFGQRPWLLAAVLACLFFLALIARLDDLGDLPLDFHPTRQLWSALIARGMYYQDLESVPEWQRNMAITQWKSKDILEPRLLETIVAVTYRLAGAADQRIPRLFSILFWLVGGVPLYLLSRDLTGQEGALAVTVFYLFVPYATIASRSFQPEPLMIAGMILALWALYHWQLFPDWLHALLAGGALCLAIFIKSLILFPLLGGMAGLFLSGRGFKRMILDPQVWSIILIALAPNLVYLVYGTFIGHFLEGSLSGRFFPELLRDPWFYVRWELKINQLISHAGLALSLLGILFYREKTSRWMVAGLWLGYLVYGLIFNYQISTHDYYHLPLIPIASLSLAPLADRFLKRLLSVGANLRWTRLMLLGLLLVLVGLSIWRTHTLLGAADYRGEAASFASIQTNLGRKAKVVALTEDYGYRLAYWGWMNARIWPSYGDLIYQQKLRKSPSEFRKTFTSLTSGMDYFLITWLEELEYQPELKAHLLQNYPVFENGDGYLVFDLKHRKVFQPGGQP